METTLTGGAAAREMPIIHTIMRTEFASVQALVTEVDPRDTRRVAAIADHLSLMLDLLHYHHGTEDELIWPVLKQRARLDSHKEWEQVGEQSFAKFTPAQRWIALGLLTEVGTPESATMLSELPMPVKVLWRLVGHRRYRQYIAPVRGA